MTLTYCPPASAHPIHATPCTVSPALPVSRLIAEIVTPDGQTIAPQVSGWEIRVWPVARLGDATLQAQALLPHLDADHLREALTRAGVTVLGPLREHR